MSGREGSLVQGERLSVSPALAAILKDEQVPRPVALVDRRSLWICGLSILLAVGVTLVGQLLVRLIYFVTSISFFGTFSWEKISPAGNSLGIWVVLVPVAGAAIIGLMARYGAQGIRGHGIPEAIEQVLLNQSRIPARMTFLKPLSAAISIGTGGPFGVEGPIIATGGAFGSLLGQLLKTSALERKTLLAAGAAAGVAATFGSPVAAVLLAIELLLFEYRPRSIIPVALASATAAAIRMAFEGAEPAFSLPDLATPTLPAQIFYLVVGLFAGLAAIGITKMVMFLEDLFDHMPIHWMWCPAIGAIFVGIIGYVAPRTLGAGYENIDDLFHHRMMLSVVLLLGVLKLTSWCIAVGSGTSGGTLAPLFTIGSCLGTVVAEVTSSLFPDWGIDVRIAALVGMAALFAGASRALLTSVVLAFETTLQPVGLLPLLAGCSASYLLSCYFMRESLMTGKMASRGVRVPAEYRADLLDQILVKSAGSMPAITLQAEQTVAQTRAWLESGVVEASHQGYPVVSENGNLVGVLTRRDLSREISDTEQPLKDLLKKLPRFVYEDCTLRQAVEHLVAHDVGRLPIVTRAQGAKVIGMLTRSDILAAYRRSLDEQALAQPSVKLPPLRKGGKTSAAKR